MSMIIKAVGLGKQVATAAGSFQILPPQNLNLSQGQSLAVMGASGSGKSTLLGLLAGLDEPSSGHVELFGKNLSALSEDGRASLRAGRVGFVFQAFHLVPTLTALENVMMPIELLSLEGNQEQAIDTLAEVGLQDRLHHYPAQLSGGEQQRVALARAFVLQPEVLMADEPTGNLDHDTGSMIIDMLFNLVSKHQTAIVLATHDANLGQRCDQLIQLA